MQIVQTCTKLHKQVHKSVHSKRVQERTVIASLRQQVVKMRQPNNAYILNDRSCCEVVSQEYASDTDLCKVFQHLESYTLSPCDLRLYWTFRTTTRSA